MKKSKVDDDVDDDDDDDDDGGGGWLMVIYIKLCPYYLLVINPIGMIPILWAILPLWVPMIIKLYQSSMILLWYIYS